MLIHIRPMHAIREFDGVFLNNRSDAHAQKMPEVLRGVNSGIRDELKAGFCRFSSPAPSFRRPQLPTFITPEPPLTATLKSLASARELDRTMQETNQRGTAPDSPKSASRFVRRSAASIRAGAQGLSQHRAEYRALIDWARQCDRLLPFTFIEQFDFVGEGAEHSADLGLLAADAHDRNIIRDLNGRLAAIDLIIGPPSESRRSKITEFLKLR